MPKIVEYPLASFDKVLQLADAVDHLGGSCTIQDCAVYMKKKVSGGFGILISSAIKHDLIIRRQDRLSSSDLYRKIKLSYNQTEKIDYQRVSFLHPRLYRRIYERFRNKELPYSMLDKLLIREFDVEENVSQKVAYFFIDGLKRLHFVKDGKLGSSDKLPFQNTDKPQLSIDMAVETEPVQVSAYEPNPVQPVEQISTPAKSGSQAFYTVSIKGAGIDSSIEINNQDDFLIVEAMLGKVRRSLLHGQN